MTTAETLQKARALGLNVYAPRPQDAEHRGLEDALHARELAALKNKQWHQRNDAAALAAQNRLPDFIREAL